MSEVMVFDFFLFDLFYLVQYSQDPSRWSQIAAFRLLWLNGIPSCVCTFSLFSQAGAGALGPLLTMPRVMMAAVLRLHFENLSAEGSEQAQYDLIHPGFHYKSWGRMRAEIGFEE